MNLILPIIGAAIVCGLFVRNARLRWWIIAIVIVSAVTRYYFKHD